MKKSSKRFLISSETKNVQGFGVRTAGIDITEYVENNPIMLFMHRRSFGTSKDDILPLGNFVDLEFVDGKLYGTPQFDSTDAFAMSIYNKVENGTIRMASAGLRPIEWGDDANDPWLERSQLVEISIVDIGANPDAHTVALYDDNDKIIELSSRTLNSFFPVKQIQKTDMKLIQLQAPVLLPLLKLADGATETEITSAIQNLVTLSATQASEIITLTSGKKEAEDKASELKAELDAHVKLANETKIKTLVSEAVLDRKITEGQREQYETLAAKDFETTESLLKGMSGSKTVKEVISGNDPASKKTARVAELMALSSNELFLSGGLAELKKLSPEDYQLKIKED